MNDYLREVTENSKRGHLKPRSRALFDGPCIRRVAKRNVKVAFSGQNIHRQSTLPNRDTQEQRTAVLDVEKLLIERRFNDLAERRLHKFGGIQEAHSTLLEPYRFKFVFAHSQRQSHFTCVPNRNANLEFLKLGKHFRDQVEPQIQMLSVKAEKQIVNDEHPS